MKPWMFSIFVTLVVATIFWGIGKILVLIGLINNGIPYWLALILAVLHILYEGRKKT